MKFKSVVDMQRFLLEIEQDHTQAKDGWVPSERQISEFMGLRRGRLQRHKSFRRSQAGKESWRHNRYKHMKGIRAFHHSTEGKQFHRSLGRMLATRHTGRRLVKSEALDLTLVNELSETLKAISSLRTHLFIELDYFHEMNEEADLHILIEETIPVLYRVEESLLHGRPVDKDDLDLLVALVHPEALKREMDEAAVDAGSGFHEASQWYDAQMRYLEQTCDGYFDKIGCHLKMVEDFHDIFSKDA